MCTPSGIEISVTGPHVHGGLGGPRNSLSSQNVTSASFITPVPSAKMTLGHSCPQGLHVINVTIKQSLLFFSVPLDFVFLHGCGIGGAILEAK